MKIRYNEDAEVVARLREALLKKGLYCPCRLQKIEDNVCMCREFREQIAEELAHHDGIHNAVKLLEDVAQNDGQRKIEKGRQRRAGQQRVAFACRAIHLRSRSVRHDDHTRFRVISYFSL